MSLRRKSPWEAIDGGLLLWRENLAWFLLFFALPFWICAFALRLLPGKAQYVSWLVLWLLRPLFERPILHVISVRFFESGAGVKQLCRGLSKMLFRGLAGDLLWRRFSPLRSAMMPVRTLENSGWGKFRGRKKNLRAGGLGYGFFLTLWAGMLEIALLAGEILFFVIMAEFIQDDLVDSLGSSFARSEIFIFAAWCVNYMLVETLYVCMGFSLYLNSRVETEGWDIEILFRELAEKHGKKSGFQAAVLGFCLFAAVLAPRGAFALDSDNSASSAGGGGSVNVEDSTPLDTLKTILESPDFGGEKDTWGIRLRNPIKPTKPPALPNFDIASWMERLRLIFAIILRLIIIALITALAVFLLYYLRKYYSGGKGRVKDSASVYALNEAIAEQPDVLLAKARFFFAGGELRLAWGFCAAAAAAAWPLYRGLVFPPDATEYDCAEMVRSSVMTANGTEKSGGEVRAFTALMNHWIGLAYAGRIPPEGSFEEAARFCESLGARNG